MAILPQYLSIFPKDNANRGQNKMNEFIFYAGVQLIFALSAKIVNSSGTRNVLGISFSCKHESNALNLHNLC